MPFQLSTSCLSILTESDVWVIPRPGCASHPVALAFYVPAFQRPGQWAEVRR